MEFQLFRIKVFPSSQTDLFQKDLTRFELLKQVILSNPTSELKKGLIWHIGNIIELNDSGIYFRLGRTSKSTIEIYQDGNFIDTEFETAPYTHVFLDFQNEVCAIARKSRLAPKTIGIANQFIKLLNNSIKAKEIKVNFDIGDLKDPENFISHLKHAYSISKFWVSYTRPNAFDVNEDFIKPSQKLVEESNSNSGRTSLEGENLKPDVLEELARSAAATGDDAQAWLKSEENERIVKKKLRGNPVIIVEEKLEEKSDKKRFFARMRNLYSRIRGEINKNVK